MAKKTTARAVETQRFIPPQLATLFANVPPGEEWLHEIKYDGYRTGARVSSGEVQMFSRRGLNWTHRFGPIPMALSKLKVQTAYLDGEIAVVNDEGVSVFSELQDALSKGATHRLTYFIFDLLHLNFLDLRSKPLIERKQALYELLASQPKNGPLRYSSHVQGQGPDFHTHACALHLEGIVSKLANSPYRSERSTAWRKIPCSNRREFVVGGWSLSDKKGRDLKSLLVGYYRQGKLIFAGRLGTGFNMKISKDLTARLSKITQPQMPFEAVPKAYLKGALWVKPTLVVEGEFKSWTGDHLLRQASYKGLREDKKASTVTLERPIH
jgi:bifunctional non-homologous end joining protein LigD